MSQIVEYLPIKFQFATLQFVCSDLYQLCQSMHNDSMNAITQFIRNALINLVLPLSYYKSSRIQQTYLSLFENPVFSLRFPSFLRTFHRKIDFSNPVSSENFKILSHQWLFIPLRVKMKYLFPKEIKMLLIAQSQWIGLNILSGADTHILDVNKFKYQWSFNKLRATSEKNDSFLENGYYVRFNEDFVSDLQFNDYGQILSAYDDPTENTEMFASFLLLILDDKYWENMNTEPLSLSIIMNQMHLARDTIDWLQRTNRLNVLWKILPKLMKLNRNNALKIMCLDSFNFDYRYHVKLLVDTMIGDGSLSGNSSGEFLSDEDRKDEFCRLLCPKRNRPIYQHAVCELYQMNWILNVIRLHERFNLIINERIWLARRIWYLGQCRLENERKAVREGNVKFIRSLWSPAMFGNAYLMELIEFLHRVNVSREFRTYLAVDDFRAD